MKKGFTLSEVLVTIAILGIIAVLIIPQLTARKPNTAKLLFKKSYQLTSQVVSGILSDDKIYKPDANGDTLFSKGESDIYFCQKFAAQLNIVGDVTCNNSITSLAFVTPDGMKWSINGDRNKFSLEGAEVIINVNPDASQVGATGTQGVDYFVIKIKDNGQIYVDGNKEKEYLTECEGSNCDEPSTPGVVPDNDCTGSGMALIGGVCCQDFNGNGECDYNEGGSGSGDDCSGSGMALIGGECCQDFNGNGECDYYEGEDSGCKTDLDCPTRDDISASGMCSDDGQCWYYCGYEGYDVSGDDACPSDHGILGAECAKDCNYHENCYKYNYAGCIDRNNNSVPDYNEDGTVLECLDYGCVFRNCSSIVLECVDPDATVEEKCSIDCDYVDDCWYYVSSCPEPETSSGSGSGSGSGY